MESLSDWVWEVDAQGVYTYASPNVEAILGYRPDEITGKTPFDLMPAGEADRIRSLFEQAAEANHPIIRMENTNLHKNGRRVVLETSGLPVFDSDGTLVGYRGIDRDITAHKQAEAALIESEQKYRNLFEAAADGIFIVEMTGMGPRIVDCNPRAATMLGFMVPMQLVGCSPLDFSPDYQPDGTPSAEGLTRIVEGAMTGDRQQISWIHTRRDGSELEVEVNINRIMVGGRPCMQAVMRDMTETLRALRQFAAIVEGSPMGIHMYRLDGDELIFSGANPAADRILGVDNSEFVGKTLEQAFPPLADTEIPSQYKLVARDGTTWRAEQVDYEDAKICGAFEVQAFRFAPGQLATFFSDITERKQFEAQVLHTQKLEGLGVLAGGIAHDFNNLLTGILGNADLALYDLPADSPAREFLVGIETASRRAGELCHQMLAYSGRGSFVVRDIDLRAVVEEMAQILEASISKKVTLENHFAENLPAVRSDATQIRQVVMNLITNASEALEGRPGRISIDVGVAFCNRSYLSEAYFDDDLPDGDYIFLEVKDTGTGMSPEVIQRIFDPFFTTKFTGRGLGMASVLGIVRGHRGAIRVSSTPGMGTTIRVLLPASEEPAETLSQRALPAETPIVPGTVLIVDDEPAVRQVAKRMFERLGYRVLLATNGAEGIDAFRRHIEEVTLVLLDLTMPDMDGDEAFFQLRQLREDVRVILASGYNRDDVSNRLAGRGLAGFLQKPIRFEELRRAVMEI